MGNFKEEYARGLDRVDRKAEEKALKKSRITDEFVTIGARGDKEMTRFLNRGWEVVAGGNTGYGVIIKTYLMRKNRMDLVADLAKEDANA